MHLYELKVEEPAGQRFLLQRMTMVPEEDEKRILDISAQSDDIIVFQGKSYKLGIFCPLENTYYNRTNQVRMLALIAVHEVDVLWILVVPNPLTRNPNDEVTTSVLEAVERELEMKYIFDMLSNETNSSDTMNLTKPCRVSVADDP